MTARLDRGFPRARRLTGAPHFRRVFAEPMRTGKTGFIVLYRSNGLSDARLGLAIAKKCARRAVDRNRLKRLVRESFRAHAQSLPGVDIVVLCARGAPALSNQRLFELLERAWATIGHQPCVAS